MKNRVKLKPGDQAEFINNAVSRSGLSAEKIAKLIHVHPRSFRDWRREKHTMSLLGIETISKKLKIPLPEDKDTLVLRWKKSVSERNKNGGIARFAKHGSPATLEGRRKGGVRSVMNLKKMGFMPEIKAYKFPEKHTEDLAEFVGIMLGDGGLTASQCTVTLNSEKDMEYSNYIISLGERLFGEKPKIFKRKDEKTLILYYNGVSLSMYLNGIGLKTGNKIKQQVGVPSWITSPVFKKACLRGLIDTDGGIFLHKYIVKGKQYAYRKLSFTNRSLPLLDFVQHALEELEFSPKRANHVVNKKVWLYNMQEVDRYLKEVGTNNPRLMHLYGG